MRTTRTGYLMAMAAGVAIVGASTGGVLAANSHHREALIADQRSAAVPETMTPSTTTTASALPAFTAAGASSLLAPTTAAPPGIASGSTSVAIATRSPTADMPTTPTSAPRPTTSSADSTATARTTQVGHQFKDGKYSATGSYNSPGGIEKLGVTITLVDDKVTTSALDLQGGAGLSHSFQSAFASAYSPQVIGRDITSIALGSVSGSSLTGTGFNAALKQIEAQARVQK